MTTAVIPEKQHALQLIGSEKLRINRDKEVFRPGPHQVLARIEAVGLCFSDLKLLNQFSSHARKTEILSGLSNDILAGIPSYVPGDRPTVPGHEVVCRIVAVGDRVSEHSVGERCLVQTDYRNLKTVHSNSAFGYNFEGGLQEYVLMDERVVIDPVTGERYLIPVNEELGSSEVCLVEPWGCVEGSYLERARRFIRAGGKLALVIDPGRAILGLAKSFPDEGTPGEVSVVCDDSAVLECMRGMGLNTEHVLSCDQLPDDTYDDIVYFGSARETIEALGEKLAPGGIINIVLGGDNIGEEVRVGVGRIHYQSTCWIGTVSDQASDSYGMIPVNGEIRNEDRVLVMGAAGPMGQMHVIRNICSGRRGLEMVGTDLSDERLESLRQKTEKLAADHDVRLELINNGNESLTGAYSYIAIMVPRAELVEEAIQKATDGCIINIFAGIPAPVKHELNLDACIRKRCFMFGTSGSTIEDMKIVLKKVTDGNLDTNSSVDAVSGLAGAADGMEAVRSRTLAGKIIVYPMLNDVGLIPLEELHENFPTVASRLENGCWNREAEAEFIRVAG
jgi:threonine dehydrogenase-like Zn-dependent dehydrogenase